MDALGWWAMTALLDRERFVTRSDWHCGRSGSAASSRDTLGHMRETVAVRELRNHGGRILDRVEAGETLIVASAGRPVAELRPLSPPAKRRLSAQELIAKRQGREPVDIERFRADIDAIFDQSI